MRALLPARAGPPDSPVSPQASSEKPKRPISAMFIFSEEKRKQLQEERPELSESELTRLLARMWNDLSEKKKVGTIPVFLLHPLSTAPVSISGCSCPCPAPRGTNVPWSIAVTCHTGVSVTTGCASPSHHLGGQNPPDRETSEGL